MVDHIMNLIIVTYYYMRIGNATSRVLDYYSTIDNEKWATNFILANFINLLFTFFFFQKEKGKKKTLSCYPKNKSFIIKIKEFEVIKFMVDHIMNLIIVIHYYMRI